MSTLDNVYGPGSGDRYYNLPQKEQLHWDCHLDGLRYSRFLAWLSFWKDTLKDQVAEQFGDPAFFASRRGQNDQTLSSDTHMSGNDLDPPEYSLQIFWKPYLYDPTFSHTIQIEVRSPDRFASAPKFISAELCPDTVLPQSYNDDESEFEFAMQRFSNIWERYADRLVVGDCQDGQRAILFEVPQSS